MSSSSYNETNSDYLSDSSSDSSESDDVRWLSSEDINFAVEQYLPTDIYSDFLFVGPYSADFYELPQIDFNKVLCEIYKKKYKKIGIMLNTDILKKGGSHWVALLIDKENENIEYMDPFGDKPIKRFYFFINKIYCILGKKYTLLINNKKVQYNTYQCGVISLYYIENRLKSQNTPKQIINSITDEKIQDARKLYLFL